MEINRASSVKYFFNISLFPYFVPRASYFIPLSLFFNRRSTFKEYQVGSIKFNTLEKKESRAKKLDFDSAWKVSSQLNGSPLLHSSIGVQHSILTYY